MCFIHRIISLPYRNNKYTLSRVNTQTKTELFVACDSGVQLATASGDTTVKIWDFANATCIQTFADHQKAGTYNSH